jgi:hypothetical protein
MSAQLHSAEFSRIERSSYETPRLILLGPVTANTLGQNGSSSDGSTECTQRGNGNDCRNLPKPACCP